MLAKIAASIAKRRPDYGGVVDLSGAEAERHLADFDVGEVWGIGPRYARFLKSEGEENVEQPDLWKASGLPPILRKQRIETALELKRCPDWWVRKHLTIKGLRLVWELRGIPCLPLEVFEKPRKGLCCSRSFGRPVTTIEDLGEAVDGINRKHGRHMVCPLAMSHSRGWEMKRGRLSGRYTTRLDEVLRVEAQ